jgi:hypothetical protein
MMIVNDENDNFNIRQRIVVYFEGEFDIRQQMPFILNLCLLK